MPLLTLLIPLAALPALLCALVFAYKRLRLGLFLWLLGALCLVPVGWWKYWERQFVLDAVPQALGVREVAYRLEESWGFGPGGNEAGIRFYPLDEAVARTVARGGVAYLEQLPPNVDQERREWRGLCERWSETPVRGEPWRRHPDTWRLDVTDYICAYGFCIDIDPARLQQANEIVSQPGSFYAHGRIGLIVVSPARRVVLYLYNG